MESTNEDTATRREEAICDESELDYATLAKTGGRRGKYESLFKTIIS